MNKSELVEAISERLGDKRAASHAVDAVFDTITRAVAAGDKVTVTGFGTFEPHARAARRVRNPRTGEALRKKKRTVPRFRPGSQLRAVVAGEVKLPRLPRAQFKQVVSGEKKLPVAAKRANPTARTATPATTAVARRKPAPLGTAAARKARQPAAKRAGAKRSG